MQKRNNITQFFKVHTVFIHIAKISFSLFFVMFLCAKYIVFASEDKSQIQGTITVMASEDAAVMKPYNDAFMRKYPNIKVEYQCLSDYENTITNLISSGNFGDVIYMPSYVDSKTLSEKFAPLGAYQELSMLYNYVDKSARIGNSIYSIPSSAYLAGIIYNKDLFYQAGISELPKSIDEFYQDMFLIKSSTNAIPFCSNYGFDWAVYNWCNFPYIEMTGDSSYKANGFIYEENPFLEGSNHYQVYHLLYNLVKNGLVEKPVGDLDWEQATKQLNEGKLACVVIGSWAIHHFKEAGPNSDSIGFMPFPNEINGQQYATVLTDYSYGVNRNSQSLEAAKTYVHFMLQESGYALEQERISVLKSDLLPDSYHNFNDITCLSVGPYEDNNYIYYDTLRKSLDPDNISELKHIIEAAAGFVSDDFDTIMLDWNNRWESARPTEMKYHQPSSNLANLDQQLLTNSDSANISLSELELKYIQEHPQLKIGYLSQMAPIQFMDQNNNFSGLSETILNQLILSTGCTAQYYPYNSTAELIHALDQHEIDIAAGVPRINEYQSQIKFSKGYLSYSDVIIKPNTIDFAHLNSDKQAILVGEPDVTSYIKADSYIEASTFDELLKLVRSSVADFAIANCYCANYYVHDLYNHELSTIPLPGENEICLGFSKDAEYPLISICNKNICDFSESTLQMYLLDYMDAHHSKITLRRFIETYPIECVSILIFIFLLFGTTLIVIRIERVKIAASHASIAKRYATLSKLLDEYIFDYDLVKKQMHLDLKFDKICGINGLIDISSEMISNPLIRIISENCTLCTNNEQSMFVSDPFLYTDINDITNWYRITLCHIEEKGISHQNYLIGKLTNVQHEMEVHLSMQNLAQRDGLTGLNNRIGFEQKFTDFSQNFHADQGISFAILDMDDFKSVNDKLGHDGGDEALKLLADDIALIQNKNMISARFGGDEFIICIFGTSLSNAQNTYQRLVKSINRDFEYNDKSIHLSISLGAVYVEECLSYPELLRLADKVLYKVKRTGKNRCEVIEKGILENE